MTDFAHTVKYDGRMFQLSYSTRWHHDGLDPRRDRPHTWVEWVFDHPLPVNDSKPFWYRYQEHAITSSSYDMNGEWMRSHHHGMRVELEEYRVVRATPKGVWLSLNAGFGPVDKMCERFVLRGSRKQYACPTKEAAMISFMARKRRQIKILENQLQRAKEAMAAGERVTSSVADNC